MKISLIATFLSNRNIQPAFIPAMAYYFGWQYTIVVSISVIIFSVLNGFLVEKISNFREVR
ncbi:MAG: hypothetical protein COX29_01620 [Candidatus Moranbacteria bacterium CG23_combo_of_CG06-09_8_20_14_all_35_22]|nr:MAG: hypothetical protein COX29_01620 [Candidatus Moranbacteria bacterium CG23_combo_of_CG06-09_8_20_14_all_35_22]